MSQEHNVMQAHKPLPRIYLSSCIAMWEFDEKNPWSDKTCVGGWA